MAGSEFGKPVLCSIRGCTALLCSDERDYEDWTFASCASGRGWHRHYLTAEVGWVAASRSKSSSPDSRQA